MVPLNETRQSLQSGNITAAVSNLNTTDNKLEQLKEVLELTERMVATP
jgi:hypothetical protein